MLDFMIHEIEEMLEEFEYTNMYPFEQEFIQDIRRVIEAHRDGRRKWLDDPKR